MISAAASGSAGQKCPSVRLSDGYSGRRGKGQGVLLFTPGLMTTKLRTYLKVTRYFALILITEPGRLALLLTDGC